MLTIGYILLALGLAIVWEVSRGRVGSLGPDLGHLVTSLLRGDYKGVQSILGATGGSNDPAPNVQPSDLYTNPSLGGSALVEEARKLAAQANNRYTYGGADAKTGFDCSGLVWRSMYELGIYKGPRFTTDSFPAVARSKNWGIVKSPGPGDVVLFPGSGVNGHMGIATGSGRYFSALSTRSGIKEGPISNHPGTPVFFQVSGAVYGLTPSGQGHDEGDVKH